MFNKKCTRCGRKMPKEYYFCPYCGNDFRFEKSLNRERDFGLLGKDDIISDFPDFRISMPFGFNGLFKSLLKEVDKQFREMDKEMATEENINKIKKQGGNGISISISTSSGKRPEIKVKRFGQPEEQKGKQEVAIKNLITEQEARKLSRLPKKEAETKVRRLSNKLIYELDLPGVQDIKDVIINKLESSIEIKAFAKDKAYFKLLPVKLTILDYKLEDGKLILEFNPRN
jgi:hypothetical protein